MSKKGSLLKEKPLEVHVIQEISFQSLMLARNSIDSITPHDQLKREIITLTLAIGSDVTGCNTASAGLSL